jgi:hypothetical protein
MTPSAPIDDNTAIAVPPLPLGAVTANETEVIFPFVINRSFCG